MPTNRRRKTRAASIPPIICGLFLLGTGWNHIEKEKGLDWIRGQWGVYGHAFDSDSWGFYAFGDPEKYKKREKIDGDKSATKDKKNS